MNASISQFRLKRLREQTQKTESRERPAFRKSVWLAALYESVFVVLASLLLALPAPFAAGRPFGRVLAPVVALCVLCVACFHETLKSLHKEKEHWNTHLCLLYTTLLAVLAVGDLCCLGVRIVLGHTDGVYATTFLAALPILLPHFLAPAALTLLVGPVVGTLSGLGLAMLLTLQMLLRLLSVRELSTVETLPFVAASFVTGLLAAAFVPRILSHGTVRRRSRIVRASLLAAVAPIVGLVSGTLILSLLRPEAWTGAQGALRDLPVQGWTILCLGQILLALASMVGQSILVAMMLPLLEHFFALTSDITLQNYTDLASPLQERLSLEAPGTHNHCTTVATLASKAAECIGANPLLARVGAYYHDIGKLGKPLFFVENQGATQNPHDTLRPTTSATWLRAHVKNGIAIADQYRLPLPIRQIIAEHHGTTVMSYFLHKAQQEAKEAAEKAGDGRAPEPVDESLFRYDGPKPSSRESGILMLADSVEAASRSLEHPTPAAISSLVDNIFQAKILDGQFDDCPLTLRDIAEIRKSFVSSLVAVLHARIAYPKDDEKDEKE